MKGIFRYAEHLYYEARHNVWALYYAEGGQTTRTQPDFDDEEIGSIHEKLEKASTFSHLEMENQQFQDTKITTKQKIRKEEHIVFNPFHGLGLLKMRHWLALSVAWLAIYADFLDNISMAIATRKIALYYNISKTQFATALTLTLILRPIGAIIFGFWSDSRGRRLPLAVNLTIMACLQMSSIFAKSFPIFLMTRAFLSIAMGGIYGMTAQVYDSAPVESRGLLGGLLHCAISCAGITAAGLNMAFGDSPGSFKLMFWVGVAVSFFAALVRLVVPDSPQFSPLEDEILFDAEGGKSNNQFRQFGRKVKIMFSESWPILIYCTIFVSLNAWINGCFHSTYFTFLMTEKGISNSTASIMTMISAIGVTIGMILGGALSQVRFFGRRRIAALCAFFALTLLPAALLPSTPWGLTLGINFFYLFLHGYSGVMHSHLNELSPPAFRAFFTGTVHQLGTMLAAPAAQIVTAIAESHHIRGQKGNIVNAYSPTIAISVGILLFLKIVWVSIGPEHREADLQDFQPVVKSNDEPFR